MASALIEGATLLNNEAGVMLASEIAGIQAAGKIARDTALSMFQTAKRLDAQALEKWVLAEEYRQLAALMRTDPDVP